MNQTSGKSQVQFKNTQPNFQIAIERPKEESNRIKLKLVSESHTPNHRSEISKKMQENQPNELRANKNIPLIKISAPSEVSNYTTEKNQSSQNGPNCQVGKKTNIPMEIENKEKSFQDRTFPKPRPTVSSSANINPQIKKLRELLLENAF